MLLVILAHLRVLLLLLLIVVRLDKHSHLLYLFLVLVIRKQFDHKLFLTALHDLLLVQTTIHLLARIQITINARHLNRNSPRVNLKYFRSELIIRCLIGIVIISGELLSIPNPNTLHFGTPSVLHSSVSAPKRPARAPAAKFNIRSTGALQRRRLTLI